MEKLSLQRFASRSSVKQTRAHDSRYYFKAILRHALFSWKFDFLVLCPLRCSTLYFLGVTACVGSGWYRWLMDRKNRSFTKVCSMSQ